MQLLFSTSHCIYENLAYEDYLLRHTNFADSTLLIYRNSPSIVLGRFQNPWRECSSVVFQQQEIRLARRQSGGGTVYHDLGNLNFCLFQKNKLVDKSILLNWLIVFFAKQGLTLKMNERFDLLVESSGSDYKVSGSAYKQTKEGSFHHCTLLINAKLELVQNYLHHNFYFEFTSKSIPSVRSSVMNLQQIRPELSVEMLLHQMQLDFEFKMVDPSALIQSHAEAAAFHTKMQARDWILGETPAFEARRGQEFFQVSEGKLKTTNCAVAIPYIGEWFDPSKY